MKNATRILTTLAAGLATFAIVAPAHAADGDSCDTTTLNAITDTELDALQTGMRKFMVKRMVGNLGVKNKADSSDALIVREFTFCEYGVDAGTFRLSFDQLEDGLWRIAADQD